MCVAEVLRAVREAPQPSFGDLRSQHSADYESQALSRGNLDTGRVDLVWQDTSDLTTRFCEVF